MLLEVFNGLPLYVKLITQTPGTLYRKPNNGMLVISTLNPSYWADNNTTALVSSCRW